MRSSQFAIDRRQLRGPESRSLGQTNSLKTTATTQRSEANDAPSSGKFKRYKSLHPYSPRSPTVSLGTVASPSDRTSRWIVRPLSRKGVLHALPNLACVIAAATSSIALESSEGHGTILMSERFVDSPAMMLGTWKDPADGTYRW